MHKQLCDNENLPLVTVLVCTFRSSRTVIETLKSVKAQTYDNIELIVSDDCSPDDTIEVCSNWLNSNSMRFRHYELVTSELNTGVSGNINRGAARGHGKWLKVIAGDDLLTPSAIEDFVSYVTKHPEVRICVSDVECFSDEGDVPNYVHNKYSSYFILEHESYPEQWKRICRGNIFVGPAYFVNRELFDEVGGYSAEYGNGEEWPFIYNILKHGNRVYTIDKKLVKYRISFNSLCRQTDSRGLGNQSLFYSTYNFFFDHPFKDLIRERRYLAAFHYYAFFKSKKLCFETGNAWYARLLNNMTVYCSPFLFLKKLNIVD